MKTSVRFFPFALPLLVGIGISPSVLNAQQVSHSPAVTEGFVLIKEKKCLEALTIFQKAASTGDAEAAEQVGGLYEWGYGCPNLTRDYQKAMIWYVKAVSLGSSTSMSSIAELYRTGKGVPQDIDKVLEWDHKAETAAIGEGNELEKNVAHASVALDNLIKQNPDQLATYKDRSAQDDVINAAIRNADSTNVARINSMGLEELLSDLRINMRKAATDKLRSLDLDRGLLTIVQYNHGGSDSLPIYNVTQIPLAVLDTEGIHAEASSAGTSVVLHAKSGTPDDLLTNTNGFHVRHNVSNSIEFSDTDVAAVTARELSRLVQLSNKSISTDWLAAARAEREHAGDPEADMRSAYNELGMNALNSNAGKRNSIVARYYFEQAAQNGDSQSAIQLARIYEEGLGVQQDLNEAKKWYSAAKISGDGAADQEIVRIQNEIDRQHMAQQKAAQEQATQQTVQQQPDSAGDSDRQEKISQLQSDIQSQEQDAQNNENNANQVLNNCSGPGAALCQALGQAGAARMRQKAARERNQADADREEIQRLEGQQVEAGQRRDASYGGNLAQVTQQSPTIQETAAQQQANLQAMAAAKQQQQAQEQARLATQQNSRVAQTATASQQLSTPQQTVSAQPSCTNMTGSVQGSVTVGSDGWVSGHLTNNSVQTLYVFYTFKKDGVPSNLMSNAGATTIGPGQTVGGEGQGLYSTNADKDQARIYWYAVLTSDTNAGKQCVHTW